MDLPMIFQVFPKFQIQFSKLYFQFQSLIQRNQVFQSYFKFLKIDFHKNL